MPHRSRVPEDRPAKSGWPEVNPAPALAEHVRQVTRRLCGVSRQQLAEERRTHERRHAAIEARKQRR